MRSKDTKCHCSSNSPFSISSSSLRRATVLSVDIFRISFTPINLGFPASIIQQLGETDTSQLVKAYSASIVVSGEMPGAKCINISTSRAVLSSILRIFILPLSLAIIIDSINEVVFTPNG